MQGDNFPDACMDPGVFLDVTPQARMLEIYQHADSVHLLIYSNVQWPVMRENIV